jgi:hypothetical protein
MLSGWLGLLLVVFGFVVVIWLCRRYPNQFGMALWSKRSDENDSDSG